MDNQSFTNNANRPIRCDANSYTPCPSNTIFFSDKLNKKYDKKRETWDLLWGKNLITEAKNLFEKTLENAFK